MNFHEKNYFDVLDKEKIIYLTAESENVVESFDDDKFYVIGGLVDHNSHKVIKCLSQYHFLVFIFGCYREFVIIWQWKKD